MTNSLPHVEKSEQREHRERIQRELVRYRVWLKAHGMSLGSGPCESMTCLRNGAT